MITARVTLCIRYHQWCDQELWCSGCWIRLTIKRQSLYTCLAITVMITARVTLCIRYHQWYDQELWCIGSWIRLVIKLTCLVLTLMITARVTLCICYHQWYDQELWCTDTWIRLIMKLQSLCHMSRAHSNNYWQSDTVYTLSLMIWSRTVMLKLLNSFDN
jgi:hypothetical protein